MKAMEMRLDHARVVDMFRKEKSLPLIKDYLLNVQKTNILEVWGTCGHMSLFCDCVQNRRVLCKTYFLFICANLLCINVQNTDILGVGVCAYMYSVCL
jgi:hypothetical protein